ETTLGMDDMKTIGNYALSAATSINMTYDSLIGLAGAFSKLGKQPSTIGTSIRRLGDISLATTDKMTSSWRKLGVDQEKLQKAFAKGGKTGEDAIKGLVQQLGALKVEDPERFQDALKGLNVRSKELLATLAQMGEFGSDDLFGYFANTEAMVDAISQAEKVAQSFSKEWESVVNTFKASWTDAGLSFQESFTPILRSLTKDGPDGAMSFAEAVRNMSIMMMQSLQIVINGVAVLVGAFVAAWGGLQKLSGFLDQKVGEAFGGISTEEMNKIDVRIKNLERGGDKLTDSAKKTLKTLKEQRKVYEDNSGWVQQLTSDGEDQRKEGDKTVETVKTMATKIDEMTHALGDIKFEGLNTALKGVADNIKDMKKNLDGSVAPVIKAKETAEQLLRIDKDRVRESLRLNNMTPASATTELLKIEYDFRKKVALAAKEAYDSDVSNSKKLKEYRDTEHNAQTALTNLWKDKNKEIAKAAAGGGSAANRADTDLKNRISTMREGLEIQYLQAQYAMLEAGHTMTRTEALEWEVELARKKVEYSEEALIKAKALAKAGGNTPKAAKEVAKAEKKLWEDKNKYMKKYKKDVLDLEKKMRSAGESFADSLLAGAVGGAFKDMASDIMDVFVQPLKDEFSKLFGNEMTDIIGGFYESLTGFMQEWATNGLKSAMTVAQGNAVAGVAGQAQGDPYSAWARMAAMAATMAALGLAVGSISGGGSTVSQAEIDASKGRTEFDDESLANLGAMYADAQYPLLE
ncbi:MAG: phage tail tape measure protein, partial [Thiotrichaceae bacterium]|nr:phage tail tape measure protein [Thiotrichaceae bacterium]